ncbi:MAG TPA: GntR family transcriptional regulator [Nocardioides sp.]|jgi:DNA-binding GntR family transcriptional regulator|uniref:GntR family transcriptional regulator n=1 Tax=Nocardioides sp. TaxID=35761 RepID=UPI002E300B9A|nr:GntR family transcriptional regulator [Nocardioides sp.]HEX3931809.1 GntR family transcriptional regulator [Nocardioides sp.]
MTGHREPHLRSVASGPGSVVAYEQLAADLREAITSGRYATEERLPTEAELVATSGFSRQTVRRAFQELSNEGMIYRVRGRGTFVLPHDARYLRSFGNIPDLMSLAVDTELRVIEPLHVRADVSLTSLLGAGAESVMSMAFTRMHRGVPFCFTRVCLPLDVGARIKDQPEILRLTEPGAVSRTTIIALVEAASDDSIDSAQQTATACAADDDVARHLQCEIGIPTLRIDRRYLGISGRTLEYAINFFHPDRYEYRLQLRGKRN